MINIINIIGELNGQHVKAAKLKGEFPGHFHENEDELFFVVSGRLRIEFEDYERIIKPGEFIIIPKGAYHKPIAEEEVKVILFEPESTLNTGNIDNDFTKRDLRKDY